MTTTLTPYLSFNGCTREAFSFYAEALGATIMAMMRHADMPAAPAGDAGCTEAPGPQGDAPPDDSIMHASLMLPGGALLFAGDTPPGLPHQAPTGVMLALQFDTVEEAQRAFQGLVVGGTVTMPLAPSFWARTFGMLTDRHGVSWAISGGPVPFA